MIPITARAADEAPILEFAETPASPAETVSLELIYIEPETLTCDFHAPTEGFMNVFGFLRDFEIDYEAIQKSVESYSYL